MQGRSGFFIHGDNANMNHTASNGCIILGPAERQAIVSGLRRANVRVEKRLDGSIAVRFGERYLPVSRCTSAAKTKAPVKPATPRRPPNRQRGSDWCKNFDLKKGPKTWQVA